MDRFIIIGDIHGCIEEFREILGTLQLQPNDHLVFIGDLVDRGPDSVAVIKEARGLNCRKTQVMSNHHLAHYRWMQHEIKGGHNPMDLTKPYIREIQARISDDDRAFMFDYLPYYQQEGIIVVHAGIPSIMHELPPPISKLRNMCSNDRRFFEWVSYVRYESPNGNPLPLGQENETSIYWASKYDGKFGFCIYGHQPNRTLKYYKNALGIDTSCVFGGSLTAVIQIVGDTTPLPDRLQIVSVPAKRIYCEQSHG